MFITGWLRSAFRLATAVALVAVAEAGPNVVSGCAAGEERSTEHVQFNSPTHFATPRLQKFGRTPLCFETNQGQSDPQVQYLARGPGYTVFLTATEAVLALCPVGQIADLSKTGEAGRRPTPQPQATVLRMQLLGGNPETQAHGLDRLPGIVNYFLGNDPSKWRTRMPTYARVQYQEVYPGIGLVYYGNQKQLEYDFLVAPGADPAQIRLRFAARKACASMTGATCWSRQVGKCCSSTSRSCTRMWLGNAGMFRLVSWCTGQR